MINSYDYVEARLAEQRLSAQRRRRVVPARSRRGSPDRLGSFLRTRVGRHGDPGNDTH